MNRKSHALHNRIDIEPYWYPIVLLLLALMALFLYHLYTGVTPDRVAIPIPFLGTGIYWYGILIVGGIFLGSYVVSRLALARALNVFNAHVPLGLQQRPLSDLDLPDEIQQKLTRQKITSLGALLLQWGFDPRNLGLDEATLREVHEHLQSVPGVAEAWLVDAPWRPWNPDHVWNGILWVLILAIIGARLYHVLTPSPSMAAVGIRSPLDYFRNPYQLINLRSGGLGIYGGLAGGALGLLLYTRRQRIPLLGWADLAVVGVALGQVFGRWGNFFNQELYGRPTDLPWAISIDPVYRLPAYADFSRFHPAFLYESLWNLLTFIVLLTLLRRYSHKLLTGDSTALYLIFYAIGRILLETVRLDSRTVMLGGLDLNIAVATLVSLVVALFAAGWLVGRRLLRSRREATTGESPSY
ncbi:MAG TPA: prolipoprotein diacylglyceryl transferase [Anaerolineae bacterium]